jgi:glucokinase
VSAPTPPPTGRPTAVGLDIGGTKIAAAVVGPDAELRERVVVPAPRTGGSEATLRALLDATDRVRAPHPDVAAVGVGAAGMVEWPSGHIRWAPNSPYENLPLRDRLAEHTGLPTVVENDANAAAVAEARFGSGAGRACSITLTIGTGIGGGIVIDGQIYRGPTGIGAEVGHIIVDAEHGARCGCGATGCLEAMASGTALARVARDAARAEPGGMLADLAGDPERVTGETVFEAAKNNDRTALALFERIGFWLGAGIASLVNVLEPGIVILAGGLGGSVGDLLLAPTRSAFERYVFARPHRSLPEIVPARLGPDAGVIGAALLALDAR